jgi:hypothetical protein
MKHKVDLESDITRVWSIKDDIDLFLWQYMDHPTPMTEDQVWNTVAGIGATLELYCTKLWDDYCKDRELDEYASDEAKARRKELFESFTKNRQDWHNAITSLTPAPKKKTPKKKVKK